MQDTEQSQASRSTGQNPANDGNDLAQTASDVRSAATEKIGELRDAAQSKIEDAKSAAMEKTDQVKGKAADEIDRTAHGLEAAAEEMEGSPLQQDLLREAADGLKQIARAVQGKSVGEMVSGLSDFGRQNPLAYLGGAALAGFALARFARASSSGTSGGYQASPFAQSGVQDTTADRYASPAPSSTYAGGSEPDKGFTSGGSENG